MRNLASGATAFAGRQCNCSPVFILNIMVINISYMNTFKTMVICENVIVAGIYANQCCSPVMNVCGHEH